VSSVLFDAVLIPGFDISANALCGDANAIMFVKEAYKHGKPIAAIAGGISLIDKAALSAGAANGEFKGPGIILELGETADKAFIERFISAIAKHRFYERPDLDAIVA
jgi:catalase